MQFIYLETNFEGSNITNPLVSYFARTLPVGLDAESVELVELGLEQNVAITNDGYYGTKLPMADWLQFYQSSLSRSSRYVSDVSLVADFQFSMSPVYKSYERSVYNLLDVLATLGGLFSSISVVGLAFTRIFSYHLMISSLIRKLYHFKPRFEEEIKKKKDKKKKKSAIDEELDLEQLDLLDEGEDSGMKRAMWHYQEKLSSMKESGQRIYQSMQASLGWGKANFKFKTTGIIGMMACLRIIRKRESLRKTSSSTRQVLFYLKGRDKLDKEMDISYIIRHVRILRYFLKTVLDKDQRVLLKLKSTEFIPSSEDESKPKPNSEKKKKYKDRILKRYVEEI